MAPTIHFVTQDDCFKHVYRRSKDLSTIFERPERLRFVNLGLAAALAWNQLNSTPPLLTPPTIQQNTLSSLIQTDRVTFSKSSRKIAPNDPAFRKVHDQPNQSSSIPPSDSTPHVVTASNSKHPSLVATTTKFSQFHQSADYLDQLVGLCRRASELYHTGLSEVPEHLPQGDLYLSQGSEAAILGAIGACYGAIDSILRVEDVKPEATSTTQNQVQPCQYKKAFVNIRPPGHHCTNSEPMGFCWVNNVLIGCMYSYLTYGIDRICIVDIDLHHGNGSQQIVWNLNAQAGSLLSDNSHRSTTPRKRPLQISYSSLHDINSYPCEDGDEDRIKEASLNICVGNSINQFIQNLHIEDWSDEHDFYLRLYPKTWSAFEQHMLNFFHITHASPDRSLIFVSAGFDACEYETGQMSRFAKKLPASFYHRFARDISQFSDLHCNGRLISVLEGGYSEQTLTGSSLSYMLGSMDNSRTYSEEEYPWSLSRINQLLKLCKKRDSNRKAKTTTTLKSTPQESLEDSKDVAWMVATRRLFEHIDLFEEVKLELNKSNKLEEKQVKLQHALSLLHVHSPGPEGLRRSQRHASSSTSKKIDSSSPSKITTTTTTTPLLAKLTQPSVQVQESCTKTPPLLVTSTVTNNTSIKKTPRQVVDSSSQQELLEQDVGHHSSDHLNHQIDHYTSIDEMLGNLNIQESSSSTTSSLHEEKEQDNHIHNRNTSSHGNNRSNDSSSSNGNSNTSENLKLPKVKLVWKAGGLLGS